MLNLVTIEKILDLLWEQTGGDRINIKKFMAEPRTEWLGFTAMNMIDAGKEDFVLKFLEELKISKNLK